MKRKRQQKILELISEQICVTQEDLQNGLLAAGFDVTQSTVSRDIRELKLVKGRDEKGNYRYLSNHSANQSGSNYPQYKSLISGAVQRVDYSINNVVVKCGNGMASSACVAIDELFGDMMLGSLAGDDTIIIVTVSEEQSKLLCEQLNKLI
ncbi:MAG: hypothetical protein IKD04_04790 [Clostridia bacterium]|nr:hypothetical protein [Clostridia bacterium]